MPPYVYKDLRKGHIRPKQCIRLITLLPGSRNDTIRIRINRASVTGPSHPVYEALSYTWIDLGIPCSIEVVSTFHRSTTIQIQANLASALVHLRRQHTPRVLWIDAICLDQQNEAEKEREIKKMGGIYKRANSVVIWLGSGSERTATAFQAMSQLGRQVQWTAGQMVPAEDCEEGWNWSDESWVVPFDVETWLSIEQVLLSESFRRVWIWQEICLANHDAAIVQCGASAIPWKLFRNAVAFFKNDTESGAIGSRERFQTSLGPVANLALIPQTRHLLGMLGVTRRCGCTNPSDRIYGLLGLATQAAVPEDKLLAYLQPAYKKSTPQVYRDFAAGEIQIMRRLSILWHCDDTAYSHELPSWVPDWKKPLPYRNLNLGMFGGGREALGAQGNFGTISNNELKVNGVTCDTVRSCSATASDSAAVSEMTTILGTWCRANIGSNRLWDSTKLPFEEALVALCHVITVGWIGNRYPERLRPASLQAAKDFIRNIIASTGPIKSSSDIPLDQAVVLDHMSDALPGRKLFVTDSGRFGLGPSKAQAGDNVVSIIGSKRLLLLRAAPRGNSRIVGVCYVHGFMDLEAILGPLPKGCRVQVVGPCNDPWDMRFATDGKTSPQDPRLESRHEGWSSERRAGDGAIIWDRVAGGEDGMRSDPRHTDVEFLRRRGVAIREVCIV